MPIFTPAPAEAPARGQDNETFDANIDADLVWRRINLAEMEAFAATLSLISTSDTSTTSNSIGPGSKTFSVSAGKSFKAGMYLVLANSNTALMEGRVISYSGTSLVVDITTPIGSGTFTSWQIFQGYRGAIAPAFSAYQSTLQSVPNNVLTKILFQTEEFDTNSYYDTSTSRFTPLVAGYYQVSAGCYCPFSGAGSSVHLYKNGADYRSMAGFLPGGDSKGSCLVYLNGSTDYIEIFYIHTQGTSQNTSNSSVSTYFQAVLVRPA